MPSYTILESRGVLQISGDDRVAFLQGLTSNDVAQVTPNRVVFSTFLTPQGKYLHDFFMVARGETLLLDCEGERRADLMRRLRMYRLRSKVELNDVSEEFRVAAVTGEDAAAPFALQDSEPGHATAFGGGIAYVDPRAAELGIRTLLPRDDAESALRDAGANPADPDSYDRLRLALGVPDGSRDLIVEKSTLLESNYDTLNAISWDKGCYLGQELTARMKYRGLVKKRLMPVTVDGAMPLPGTAITLDGREVGEMRSGNGTLAIALLRQDAVEKSATSGGLLVAGDATVMVAGMTPAAAPAD